MGCACRFKKIASLANDYGCLGNTLVTLNYKGTHTWPEISHSTWCVCASLVLMRACTQPSILKACSACMHTPHAGLVCSCFLHCACSTLDEFMGTTNKGCIINAYKTIISYSCRFRALIKGGWWVCMHGLGIDAPQLRHEWMKLCSHEHVVTLDTYDYRLQSRVYKQRFGKF